MDKFEELDALLDKAATVEDLQQIREEADAAYNRGELADYQWKYLVRRSATIQDSKS